MKLSSDAIQELASQKVDLGANFLIGKATIPTTYNPTAYALSTVSNTASIVGNSIQSATLITTITTQAIAYLSEQMVSYATEVLPSLLDLPLAYMVERSKDGFSEHLKTVDQLMKEINVDVEKEAEDAQKTSDDKKKNEKLEKLKEQTKDIADKVNKGLEKASKNLNNIAYIINDGPNIVQKKLDEWNNKAITETKKFVAENVTNIQRDVKQQVGEWGYDQGKSLAYTTNNLAKQSLESTAREVEKTKKKITAKAKAAAEAALMKLKGLLGA